MLQKTGLIGVAHNPKSPYAAPWCAWDQGAKLRVDPEASLRPWCRCKRKERAVTSPGRSKLCSQEQSPEWVMRGEDLLQCGIGRSGGPCEGISTRKPNEWEAGSEETQEGVHGALEKTR